MKRFTLTIEIDDPNNELRCIEEVVANLREDCQYFSFSVLESKTEDVPNPYDEE